MAEDIILFVQQRCGKSGAPAALARLLTHPEVKVLRPVLLAGKEGWLTAECARHQVPFITLPFPSSRSVASQLWGNQRFAAAVRGSLARRGFRAILVAGNDHLEGLLVQALAKACEIPSAIFLRSSEMTRRDYLKYHCDQCDAIFAVGSLVLDHIQQWFPNAPAQLLYDGLNTAEFLPPKTKATRFPLHWLVVGSEKHDKGWQDFAAALDRLEQDPAFPVLTLDFTGNPPTSPLTDMRLDKSRRSRLNFIGRQEKFRELLRQYDLVVHPSREESFGLAMIETLAAGVPVVTSRAGVIEQIQRNPDLLFNCMDPQDQARVYRQLWQRWDQVDFDLAGCQERIHHLFSMDKTAMVAAGEFRRLIARRKQG